VSVASKRKRHARHSDQYAFWSHMGDFVFYSIKNFNPLIGTAQINTTHVMYSVAIIDPTSPSCFYDSSLQDVRNCSICLYILICTDVITVTKLHQKPDLLAVRSVQRRALKEDGVIRPSTAGVCRSILEVELVVGS
jgi:hypothetical protein